jgi:hypothetical protein
MIHMEIRYAPPDSGEWVRLADGADCPESFTVAHRPAADDDEPAWTARFQVVDGVAQCRELVVSAPADGREIRSRDLRRLRLEALAEDALARVADRRVTGEDGRLEVVRDLPRRGGGRRPGRPRITDELLAEVAEVYRTNVDRNPTAAVARHFGLASDRTARLYVKRARTAGHLGDAVPGRPGERR